ncbi:MAG: MMPL family transporter [Kibdelosporangium sp.]
MTWFGLVAAALLAALVIPGSSAPNTDAGEAGVAQTVLRGQDSVEPIRENVLLQSRTGAGPTFTESGELRAATEDLTGRLREILGSTGEVRSPLQPGATDLISADGRSGLVTFQFAGPTQVARANFTAVAKTVNQMQSAHPGVRAAMAGDRSLSSAVDEYITKDLAQSHLLSLPVTLLILVIVFGALVAAGIPALLTATVVAAAFSLLAVIGKVVAINSATSAMILLIGIAVGVDYSLFYLRRQREERATGKTVEEALRTTAHTSGHVVLVSGLTVMLCLTGLLFTGIGALRGLTIGTVLIVGLAMLGSVTVLPALLAILGRKVDAGRIPWLGRTAVRESRTWARIARAVVSRPIVLGGAATALLTLLALPAFSMHLQDPAQVNSLPRSVPAIDAAVRMQEAFPGAPTPARVVLWDPAGGTVDPDRAEIRQGVEELRALVRSSGGLLAEPIAVVPVDKALVLRVPLAGSGTDPKSDEALELLRTQVLPETFGTIDGVGFAVGGRTATPHDFADQLTERTPLVFAFVLLLAFVLLAWAFRSLAIPLVSIVLNLLSVGAAYGVMTWIFQYGNLTWLLGFTPYGGVVGWLPLFMFVMLFGLSMDYHIFILSRVRERWLRGVPARQSIVDGVAASAGVVTSAAVIMTAVFAVFVTLTAIEYKMLGVGMAFAVILDATVVRGVLLPAAMALLGDRAWWLPGQRARHRAFGPRTPGAPADYQLLP